MAIPSQTIEQIAAANDIVEVIGSYFPLKRAGANFKALCPFHQEKTPSFHVSPQRQTFHCFGCGVGGSVFRFVMDYEHIDFPSTVRKLAALDPAIGGRHLGLLGSIIIGEVIFRSVARERRRLAPTECAAKAAFEPAFWDDMTAIDSMPGLIDFAARHCGFATAPVPFI